MQTFHYTQQAYERLGTLFDVLPGEVGKPVLMQAKQGVTIPSHDWLKPA